VADPGIKFGRGTWRTREREPIMGVWGRSGVQRSPGAEPLVGGWSRKSFSFQTSGGSGRIASFCLFCKVNKPSIGQLYNYCIKLNELSANTKIWAMMGNISKTAKPSVFIFGTDLRVVKGVPAPPFKEWAPNQNLAVQVCHRSVGILSPATPARPCTVVKTILCSFLSIVCWH